MRENEKEIYKNYERFGRDGTYEFAGVDYVNGEYLDAGFGVYWDAGV